MELSTKIIEEAVGYILYSDGRMWSNRSNKFLKPQRGGYKGKYRKVMLAGKVQCYIHILVIKYFGPPKPRIDSEVNHKDGDTTNNALENLEWVSSSENTRHGVVNGLFSRTKLTVEQVVEIKTIFAKEPDYFGKVPYVAKLYKVSPSLIMAIKHNRNWKYIKITD